MTRHLLSKETLMQFEYLSTHVPCWESAPSRLLQIAWPLQTRFSQLCRPKSKSTKHCNSTSFARTKHLTNPNRPYQMPHIASGYKKTVSSVSTHVILTRRFVFQQLKPFRTHNRTKFNPDTPFLSSFAGDSCCTRLKEASSSWFSRCGLVLEDHRDRVGTSYKNNVPKK